MSLADLHPNSVIATGARSPRRSGAPLGAAAPPRSRLQGARGGRRGLRRKVAPLTSQGAHPLRATLKIRSAILDTLRSSRVARALERRPHVCGARAFFSTSRARTRPARASPAVIGARLIKSWHAAASLPCFLRRCGVGTLAPGSWPNRVDAEMVLALTGVCSFCGRRPDEVRGLAGVVGKPARICDECVGLMPGHSGGRAAPGFDRPSRTRSQRLYCVARRRGDTGVARSPRPVKAERVL